MTITATISIFNFLLHINQLRGTSKSISSYSFSSRSKLILCTNTMNVCQGDATRVVKSSPLVNINVIVLHSSPLSEQLYCNFHQYNFDLSFIIINTVILIGYVTSFKKLRIRLHNNFLHDVCDLFFKIACMY